MYAVPVGAAQERQAAQGDTSEAGKGDVLAVRSQTVRAAIHNGGWKEMKPILFNTDMVRAILDGRKTVTRRVVKQQPPATSAVSMDRPYAAWRFWEDDPSGHLIKPPYKQGDILYVRETFCRFDPDHIVDGNKYAYYADATPESERIRKEYGYKWSPSIHMPKEAARLFLRVTDVRVERLKDIDDYGVLAEGLGVGEPFDELWDSTIKKANLPLYGWAANPWAWVIEFERISKEAAYANDVEIFAP